MFSCLVEQAIDLSRSERYHVVEYREELVRSSINVVQDVLERSSSAFRGMKAFDVRELG